MTQLTQLDEYPAVRDAANAHAKVAADMRRAVARIEVLDKRAAELRASKAALDDALFAEDPEAERADARFDDALEATARDRANYVRGLVAGERLMAAGAVAYAEARRDAARDAAKKLEKEVAAAREEVTMRKAALDAAQNALTALAITKGEMESIATAPGATTPTLLRGAPAVVKARILSPAAGECFPVRAALELLADALAFAAAGDALDVELSDLGTPRARAHIDFRRPAPGRGPAKELLGARGPEWLAAREIRSGQIVARERASAEAEQVNAAARARYEEGCRRANVKPLPAPAVHG